MAISDRRVILVTGVGDYWGARIAARLAADPDTLVIGLDDVAPLEEIENLDFIQADIQNPLLPELLSSEGVDIVCHLKFVESSDCSEANFNLNVSGARKVLGACADAGVRKVVLRSSTAVYGAHAGNSAFIAEETPLRGSSKYGYTRDLVELEAFCNGFAVQFPEISLTILRFANIVGLTATSPMTRFLKHKPPRILLGFDPMMQIIHEDDVVEALVHAAQNDVRGVFNIAAEYAMPLSRILRLARRFPVHIFHPVAYKGFNLLRGSRFGPAEFAPIEWDYLRYPWVADLRLMVEDLGFSPLYRAEETLREFAADGQYNMEKDGDERIADEEGRLRDILEIRRRARERADQ
jgi:UDP-glucose 4-epimerase